MKNSPAKAKGFSKMGQAISGLSDENIQQLRHLKDVLDKHSYNTEALNGIDTSVFGLPSTLYRIREDTVQNILIRLFFIGKTVSEFEIAKLFNSDERFALIKLGILEAVADRWRASIKLFPYKDYILFCDFNAKHGKIEPIYQPGDDSLNLEEAGISQSFNCALDLCTGSGIQAFRAATSCKSVIATDVNPRVIHWLSMSLALNGINNIEVRLGDLYENVQRNRFDLITANPPFVINWKTSHKFRDGGKYGDDVLARILNELPDHWNDGGYAQIVTFLYEFEARSQLNEIRVFAQSRQLETLVLKSLSRDKFELAMSQYAEKVKNYEAYEQTISAYLDHLDRVGMISYCSAVVTFRNTGKYRIKELSGLPRRIILRKDLQELVRDFFSCR
jgi:methylase of polypeptide subunit release factors